IIVVDPATGATHSIAPGTYPFGAVFEPRAQRLYVTSGSRLQSVDPATGAVQNVAGPFSDGLGLALSRDGATAYVVDDYARAIHRVNIAGGGVEHLYNGLDSPIGIAVSPDERTAYVSQYYPGRLAAVDLTNGTVTVLAS